MVKTFWKKLSKVAKKCQSCKKFAMIITATTINKILPLFAASIFVQTRTFFDRELACSVVLVISNLFLHDLQLISSSKTLKQVIMDRF